MKKKICFIILSLVLVFSVCFIPNIKVYADDATEITASMFEDANLYNYLVTKSGSTTLTRTSLKKIATKVDSSNAELGYQLDLSFDTINSIDFATTRISFTSIKGLERFTFDTEFFITKLNLSGNSISSIGDSLRNFNKLETLNLSGNNLSKIDLSNNTNIKVLDLSANNFSSISNITLFNPESEIGSKREVYLSNNMLNNDITATSDTINYNFGLQGVKNNGIYYTSANLDFSTYVEKITKIEIKKYNSSTDTYETISQLPYEDTTTNETISHLELSYGKYLITYPESSTLTSSDLPRSEYRHLGDVTFEIKVLSPNIKYFQLDTESQQYKEVNRVITVNQITKLVFSPTNENNKIYISINGEDEFLGTEAIINLNGTNVVRYYQVTEDGYRSDTEQVVLICKLSTGISFLYILLAVVGFGLIGVIGVILYKKVYLKHILKEKTAKKEKF